MIDAFIFLIMRNTHERHIVVEILNTQAFSQLCILFERNDFCVCVKLIVHCIFLLLRFFFFLNFYTSSHDKTGFYLKRGSDILTSIIYPARVRIWVISTVTAPNKHKSCKSCSSRTGPSVTATMIVMREI